jgi:hypothetical protein
VTHEATRLVACPFCGFDKISEDFGDESACIRCRNCGCQSGRVYFTEAERESDDFSQSEADAREAWNRRAALAQPAPTAEVALPAVSEEVPEFTHDPALCIKPACPADCCGCNYAISGQQARDYAIRYAYLRSRPLDAIHAGGVFIGLTPQNLTLSEEDADRAIDAAISHGNPPEAQA